MHKTAKDDTKFIISPLKGFYETFAQPLAWTGLRVLTGALLVVEGWPKIQSPFAMAGFVEGMGLYPAAFWSAALAGLQFFGGLFLILGLLTRPVALASGLMLAVTLWFHMSHPYGAAILTPEGIAALQGQSSLFAPDAQSPLIGLAADGGAGFLHQVQFKAEGFSALWTVVTLFFAAFGGGLFSVDRLIGKEF